METSILHHVQNLPAGFGTLDQIKRYLGCKLDCEKHMLSHEASPRREATLNQVRRKITGLRQLIELMEANGAPSAQAAITNRAAEICCPDAEIEGYLFAIENLSRFLNSQRKPRLSFYARLMAYFGWSRQPEPMPEPEPATA